MKIVGRIIKILVLMISLFIYAFFMFRLCSTEKVPQEIAGIVWRQNTIEAYQRDPAGFEAITQEQSVMITDDGRFWILDVIYLPASKQLELTIKYNDSTLKYLKEALGTDTLPDEPFVYSLTDNDGGRYTEYSSQTARKQNYNYRRLVFENVDLTDIETMYVDVYYAGAVDYESTPYGSLMTWNIALPTENLDVSDYLPKELQ